MDSQSKCIAINEHVGKSNVHSTTVVAGARDVLAELYSLLAEYAPTWFTQGHFERTEATLRELNRLVPSRGFPTR